jgi:hypothetical protein
MNKTAELRDQSPTLRCNVRASSVTFGGRLAKGESQLARVSRYVDL